MMRAFHRFRFPSCVRPLFLAVLLALPVAAPVQAQSSPPDKGEVERLVRTIENDAERQKLVNQLNLLLKASKQVQKADDGSAGLIPQISDKITSVSDAVLSAAASLSDARHVFSWISQQTDSPQERASWMKTLTGIGAVLLGGLVAERLLLFLLGRPIRFLAGQRPATRLRRILPVSGWWLLHIPSLLAFFLASQTLRALPVLNLSDAASRAALIVSLGYVASRAILITIRALLMPKRDSLRLLPFSHDAAHQLASWARRLTLTGVWGYGFIQALQVLGLPRIGYQVSLRILGCVMAVMCIMLVLRNRRRMTSWIRQWGKRERLSPSLRALCERLAAIWHIPAILYILSLFFVWALAIPGGAEYVARATLVSLVILVVANLLAIALSRQEGKSFPYGARWRQRYPHLDRQADRYMATLLLILRILLLVATFLALLQAWGVDIAGWLKTGFGHRILSALGSIAVAFIGALVTWEAVNAMIDRHLMKNGAAGDSSARARTLLPLVRNVVLVVLVVMMALIVLSEIGVNIAPLLAGAGVVGVAVGFGSQKLVQDVITGAFILFEDTIAVGDYVKIGSFAGTVEGLTIRTLRLRDASGQLHTLPFSAVSSVSNLSREFGCHVFEIGVGYREDIDSVVEVMKAVGEELRAEPAFSASILEPIELYGIERFDNSAVVISGRIKTVPGAQWAAGREYRRRIKIRFDALGIEIPFPHTTLYFGVDKNGDAPAGNIRLVTPDPKAAAPAADA